MFILIGTYHFTKSNPVLTPSLRTRSFSIVLPALAVASFPPDVSSEILLNVSPFFLFKFSSKYSSVTIVSNVIVWLAEVSPSSKIKVVFLPSFALPSLNFVSSASCNGLPSNSKLSLKNTIPSGIISVTTTPSKGSLFSLMVIFQLSLRVS